MLMRVHFVEVEPTRVRLERRERRVDTERMCSVGVGVHDCRVSTFLLQQEYAPQCSRTWICRRPVRPDVRIDINGMSGFCGVEEAGVSVAQRHGVLCQRRPAILSSSGGGTLVVMIKVNERKNDGSCSNSSATPAARASPVTAGLSSQRKL